MPINPYSTHSYKKNTAALTGFLFNDTRMWSQVYGERARKVGSWFDSYEYGNELLVSINVSKYLG
jgi:hypothetical protein